jgi:hypothetical protein
MSTHGQERNCIVIPSSFISTQTLMSYAVIICNSAFNKLREDFPSRRGAQGFLTMDRDMSDAVTSRFRESASLLLQRYVEAHGHHAARYVRQSQDARGNFLLPPIGVRPYVRQIQKLIQQVEAELAEIFPAPTPTVIIHITNFHPLPRPPC